MPLFDVRCLNQHQRTIYLHHVRHKYCTTYICPECHNTQSFVYSTGQGLTYFSEKRPQVIHNLGHDPVIIRSPKEHQEAMKKAGVAPMGQRRGMPGCWS